MPSGIESPRDDLAGSCNSISKVLERSLVTQKRVWGGLLPCILASNCWLRLVDDNNCWDRETVRIYREKGCSLPFKPPSMTCDPQQQCQCPLAICLPEADFLEGSLWRLMEAPHPYPACCPTRIVWFVVFLFWLSLGDIPCTWVDYKGHSYSCWAVIKCLTTVDIVSLSIILVSLLPAGRTCRLL